MTVVPGTRAAAAVLLALLVAGCAAQPSGDAVNPSDGPRATLAGRSTSAEAVARYEQMQQGVRSELMEIDQPGFHLVSLQDPGLDAHFEFGTQVDTVMQVATGCHRAW